MPRGLKDRTAIVTGAASGLGLGISRALCGHGVRVIGWDRDEAALQAVDTALFAHRQTVDVADAAAVTQAFEQALGVTDGIDILVNNAGINGPVLACEDYPLEAWRAVLSVNLDGVFHGCRAAIPHMRECGFGRILNVASIAGKEGVPNIAAYSAAKAGVIGFSKAIAKELATSGVTVNCLAPAMVETALLDDMPPDFIATMKAKIPMGRFLRIEEVANMACWIVSDECSFTTGFAFDLTGGRATY